MDYLDADLGWLLRRDGRSCPAYVLFRTTDGGSSWVAGGCVGSKADLASAQPPSVSFVDPRDGMVTVAESTYVTADAGLTWSAPTP